MASFCYLSGVCSWSLTRTAGNVPVYLSHLFFFSCMCGQAFDLIFKCEISLSDSLSVLGSPPPLPLPSVCTLSHLSLCLCHSPSLSMAVWDLSVTVEDLGPDALPITVSVTSDLHVGGVILKLVEKTRRLLLTPEKKV